MPSGKLRTWAAEEAGVPAWLFQESYDAVGDVAETIALLLPPPAHSSDLPLSDWIENRLLPLRGQTEETQRAAMILAWRELDQGQRFVWNKLISGGFRVGVSQQLVTRALGEVGGIDPAVVAHRLMGDWEPSASFFTQLLAHDPADADTSRPYPFFLAARPRPSRRDSGRSRMTGRPNGNGTGFAASSSDAGGRHFLWSRGEELVTDRYPEIAPGR